VVSPFSKRTASHSTDSRKAAAQETAAQAEANSIAVVVTTSVTSLATVACEQAVALCSATFLGLFLLLDLDCLIHGLGIFEINLSLCSNTERLNPEGLSPVCHRQSFG